MPATTETYIQTATGGTTNVAAWDVGTFAGAANTKLGATGIMATATGGFTTARYNDLGNTGQVVKASAGQVYNVTAMNTSASARFVKIYDKATAATSSDTPKMVILIPAGQTVAVPLNPGLECTAGISVRATTGHADGDTGNPSANDVYVTVCYR